MKSLVVLVFLLYSRRFKIFVAVNFFAILTIRLIQKIIANM
jgi:hypothetical protein